jgi:hypothetical protein
MSPIFPFARSPFFNPPLCRGVNGYPITLLEAVQDGQLTGAEIARLALTADEIEMILGTEYTNKLNDFEKAEQDYPNLEAAKQPEK